MTAFVALDFPSWIRWGQRRGAFVDDDALRAVFPDYRTVTRVETPRPGTFATVRWDRVGVYRCGWCGGVCAGRRTSWCSDACSAKFYRVWSWGALAKYVAERDGNTCRRCRTTEPGEAIDRRYGAMRPRAWNVDHVVPVVDGGTDNPANLRLLCHDCHVAVGYEQRSARREKQQQALELEAES